MSIGKSSKQIKLEEITKQIISKTKEFNKIQSKILKQTAVVEEIDRAEELLIDIKELNRLRTEISNS